LLLLGAATVIRLAFGALLPLFEDEAYYWEWSRRLAPGYFDHPPAIAVLIRAGTVLLGDTPLGVRLLPILTGSLAAFAALVLASRLAGARASVRAALVFAVMPLASAGLVIATPDPPLLAASAWTLYAVVRALDAPARSASTLRWWLVAGAVLGFGFLAKYTAVLIPGAVAFAVLLHPALRRRALEPGPWLALVVAAVVSAPMLVWNAQHDWVSFVFQLQHGLGSDPGRAVDALQRVGDLLGGQAALASPILFVLMAIAVGRALGRRTPPIHFLLGVASLLPLAFFAYSATRRAVEANWPAMMYIPAGVLLVTMNWGTRFERAFRAGVGLAAVMSAVIYLHAIVPVVPLRADRDPVAEAFGWDRVAEAALAAAPMPPCANEGPTTWFAGNRYQDAAELAFQLKSRNSEGCPAVLSLNINSRANQYDLWPGLASSLRPGDHMVLVLSGAPADSAIVAEMRRQFGVARAGRVVPLQRRGVERGRRQLWVLEDWRGPE
jgi:4-amino-4-deoxy-L-arabinose transferase-like glycosyltransferase